MDIHTFKVIKEALIKDYKLEKRLSQLIGPEREKHLNNMRCIKYDYKKILNEDFPEEVLE